MPADVTHYALEAAREAVVPTQELVDLPDLCRPALSCDADIPEPLQDRMDYCLERIQRRRLARAAVSRSLTPPPKPVSKRASRTPS